MDFIKKEKDEMFKPVKIKPLRKVVYTTDQIGKTKVPKDRKRDALPPGKRISKTGKVYWETRANRSDKPGRKI